MWHANKKLLKLYSQLFYINICCMLSNNYKYMLNYCNNIAHLCLRASQSLFITSHLNAGLVDNQLLCTSLGWIRGGLYGGVDSGVPYVGLTSWIPDVRCC